MSDLTEKTKPVLMMREITNGDKLLYYLVHHKIKQYNKKRIKDKMYYLVWDLVLNVGHEARILVLKIVYRHYALFCPR